MSEHDEQLEPTKRAPTTTGTLNLAGSPKPQGKINYGFASIVRPNATSRPGTGSRIAYQLPVGGAGCERRAEAGRSATAARAVVRRVARIAGD